MPADPAAARGVRLMVLGLPAAIGLAVLVGHCRIARSPAKLGVEPTGYREIVNRALASRLRWVRLPPPSPEPRAARRGNASSAGEASDDASVAPIDLELSLDELSPAEQTFVARSFLLSDLEHPDRFLIVGERAMLRGGLRRRPLPFSESAVWTGLMSFRHGAWLPILRVRGADEGTPARELHFRLPRDRAAPLPKPVTVAFAPAPEEELVTTGASFAWPLGGRLAFSLHAVPAPGGRSSIVLQRPFASEGTLWQNGAVLTGGEVQRTLAPGDWLVFESARPPAAGIFELAQGASGVISEFRRGQRGFERSYPPSHGLEPLARSVAGVLNQLLNFLAEANARNARAGAAQGPITPELEALRRRDLRLTVDAPLQAAAQAVLDASVSGRMPPSGWHALDRASLPPRAALSITDIATGEILAAASHPTEDALDRHLDALRGHVGADRCPRDLVDYLLVTAARRRDRLLANHALDDAHQVGSTIKPLLGAGFALAWAPGHGSDPLDLQVDCAGGIHPPEGEEDRNKDEEEPPPPVPGTTVPMARFADDVHGPGVTFRRFVAQSCNAFMFRLGAEALEATPGFRPDDCDGGLGDTLGRGPADHPGTSDAARRLSPLGRFAWLTGGFLIDPESFGTGRRSAGLWSPVDRDIDAIAARLGCALRMPQTLAAVSPAITNLDARSMTRCMPDFTSLLKGGGTNTWTNVGIATAYARLITGRATEPHLLRPQAPGAGAPTTPRGFDPADCRASVACGDTARFERVRSEVLEGMGASLVGGTSTTMQGTMRALVNRLSTESGRRWGAYAKTGTSDSPREIVSAVDRRLRPRLRRSNPELLKEANYTLALVECAPDEPGERADSLACRQLPALGQSVRGVVLHLWIETVPGFESGIRAGEVYTTREGTRLVDRLVEALQEMR